MAIYKVKRLGEQNYYQFGLYKKVWGFFWKRIDRFNDSSESFADHRIAYTGIDDCDGW